MAEIDYDQYYNGNMQGYSKVKTFSVSTFPDYAAPTGKSGKYPAAPTKQNSITVTLPNAVPKGTPITINLNNFGYPNLYDCTTWKDIKTRDIAVGAKVSAATGKTKTKTFLVIV